MLECADGAFYIGQTDNLEKRVSEHQAGTLPCFTTVRLPVRLAWSQEFPSRDEAFVRERQLKGWTRAKKRALTSGDWGRVSKLAKGRQIW